MCVCVSPDRPVSVPSYEKQLMWVKVRVGVCLQETNVSKSM